MTSTSPARVLVTGGAGFIGSELVGQLAAAGHHVTVLDNLANGTRENLAACPADRVTLIVGDVRDESVVRPLMNDVRIVYHLACLGVRHSIHAPFENHEVNATGSLTVVEAARAAGVPRFVFVSTSEVYGTARIVPMTEDHPVNPTTVYGASKLAGEQYALAAWRTHGYPTVVVRPFNAFGPRSHYEGDSGEVLPKFLLRALADRPLIVFGDGTQTRDFTFVADAARGILAAGFADRVIGEVINLGTGEEFAIRDLADIVARVLGREVRVEYVEPRPGDVLRLCADVSKARRLLGFETSVSLEDGLDALLAWFRRSGKAPEHLLQTEVVRNWVGSA